MFHQPTTLVEALELKAEHGADVTAINGGTDLVVAMNHGVRAPQSMMDLSRVQGLSDVGCEEGHYLLGGGVTFAQMCKLPVRCLARASMSVGGPQIRHMGTIAGNLATASPAGDGSVALLALDAEVELSHARRGSRWVALPDYFVDYRRTALADDELITRVRFPGDRTSAWYKIGKRGAVNISIVCCAVSRSPQGQWRIALGSVAPFPIRATQAEAIVNGHPPNDQTISRAAAQAAAQATPIDDQRASARYRKAMCNTLTARLLRELVDGN